MNIQQFAEKAGLIFTICGEEWEGTIAYKLKDHPHTTYVGFESESEAYKHWMTNTFGQCISEAIMSLLDQ